jgi:PAS domain S-box-containing protein
MTRSPARERSGRLPRHAHDGTGAAMVALRQDAAPRPDEATAGQYADHDRSFIALSETAVSPMISTTPDGTISAWNPAAERLYGHTAAEAIGACIDIIIPPEHREKFHDVVDTLLIGRPGDDFETVRVTKAGQRIDVLLILSAIKSPAGETVGIINVTRDISATKTAEDKFRLAVEACPNGMMTSDAAGIITMVNGEIERLFGYRRDELVGQSLEILVPERLRRQHVRLHDGFTHHAPAARHMAGRELVGLRKDGTEFPVEVGLNPISTSGGPLVLSAIVDISERKRLDRLKDEFVAMVSHELRTPLTSISGALGLLMGNAAGPLPAGAVRLLTIAHTNSQRLVRLINDILDLQKIESGQVVFHLKHVDLRTLVDQTIDANRAFAQGFGVRIRLDEMSVDGEAFADSDRLAQILTNLLSNAVKFSPAGDEVVVAIERRDDTMRISVRDHGPGIPEGFKARIFEKFAQADSSDARQKGGTGLGLSIVKQLIHQHGGTVGFEPAAGGGTVFQFELPCSGPAAAKRAPHAPLLLCENDGVASALLASSLRMAGFAVEAVSTAVGACTDAADTPYAALLIELQLPDLDGIRLIRLLRGLPRHADTPIIVMSIDSAQTRSDLRAAALPICDWMEKPGDRGELVRVIHRAIIAIGIERPRVLHFEPDETPRRLVRESLRPHADIVSTRSVDGARRALANFDFDLAVLDLTHLDDAGLEMLAELRDHHGHAIPSLLFSRDDDLELARRVNVVLAKSRMSVDQIVATVRLVLARHNVGLRLETEVA